MWGVKDQQAHVDVYIGPKAQPKGKSPSSAMRRALLGEVQPRMEEVTYHRQWHSLSSHEAGKVLKQKRTTKVVKRKGCHYCTQCLVPDTAIFLCPYNHSQQLEGGADETSTYLRDPIQEKENYYKKGVKEDGEGGAETP